MAQEENGQDRDIWRRQTGTDFAKAWTRLGFEPLDGFECEIDASSGATRVRVHRLTSSGRKIAVESSIFGQESRDKSAVWKFLQCLDEALSHTARGGQ